MSIPHAAAVSFPRDEALLIASLLALTGGYLDACTWIAHRAFANVQTANHRACENLRRTKLRRSAS